MSKPYASRKSAKRAMARASAVLHEDVPETVTIEESIIEEDGGFVGVFTLSEHVKLSNESNVAAFRIVMPKRNNAKRRNGGNPVYNVMPKGPGRKYSETSRVGQVIALLRQEGGCTWDGIKALLTKRDGAPWTPSSISGFMRYDIPNLGGCGVRTIEDEGGDHRYTLVEGMAAAPADDAGGAS